MKHFVFQSNPKYIRFWLVLCLVFFTSWTNAARCPHATEWHHVKGEPWQLSPRAQQDGWEVMTLEGAKDSDLTEVSLDKPLLIGIMETAHRFTTCGYTLKANDHSMVIAAVNTKDKVDLHSLKAPFYCHHQRCYCDTIAGEPQMCQWEWRS